MKGIVLLTTAVAVAVIVGVVVDREPERVSKVEPTPAPAHEMAVAPAKQGDGTIQGTVREAFDVAGYTYLRLADGNSETWAAVSKTAVALGARVSIADAARMTDFHSATLKRTFPVIYFGNLVGGANEGASARLPIGHPEIGPGDKAVPGLAPLAASPHRTAASLAAAGENVAKASGANAYTIAEVFADRAKLSGKQIRVQGRIVKATRVQGVSYYRLRDGSSIAPTDAELVVSSTAERAVGDVVTFEGTPGVDVDIGIGVRYAVMLQNARDIRQ